MPNPLLKMPPDTLNTIGLLTRREIEVCILAPLIKALSAEFGVEKVREILRQTIAGIAWQLGAQLAASLDDNSLEQFIEVLDGWKGDDSLQIDVLERSETRYCFHVQRCRYAEMYRSLGVPELGYILSCSRDFNLAEGFNPRLRLTRTQTIMEGALHCDFHFEMR